MSAAFPSPRSIAPRGRGKRHKKRAADPKTSGSAALSHIVLRPREIRGRKSRVGQDRLGAAQPVHGGGGDAAGVARVYSSAIPVYEKAAGMGSVAAMNNLGNIAVVQSRYADAKMWYERALAVEPNNSTALKGLNRALGQLEE